MIANSISTILSIVAIFVSVFTFIITYRERQKERRRQEIARALELSEKLHDVDELAFADPKHVGEIPPVEEYIRRLSLLTKHIKDPDCVQSINDLRTMFDNKDPLSGVEVCHAISSVQQKLISQIKNWREKLSLN